MATNEESDLGAPSTSKSKPKCKGCQQLVQGHFLPTGREKYIFSVVESLKARTTEGSARPEWSEWPEKPEWSTLLFSALCQFLKKLGD